MQQFSVDDICTLKCHKQHFQSYKQGSRGRLNPILLDPTHCKKRYCTLVGLQVGFFIHIGEEENDIARNDNSHLWAHKWFFYSNRQEKKIGQGMILHNFGAHKLIFLFT